jgi:hypothetical protein
MVATCSLRCGGLAQNNQEFAGINLTLDRIASGRSPDAKCDWELISPNTYDRQKKLH